MTAPQAPAADESVNGWVAVNVNPPQPPTLWLARFRVVELLLDDRGLIEVSMAAIDLRRDYKHAPKTGILEALGEFAPHTLQLPMLKKTNIINGNRTAGRWAGHATF